MVLNFKIVVPLGEGGRKATGMEHDEGFWVADGALFLDLVSLCEDPSSCTFRIYALVL